jgi:Tol biopolymer transport system component
LTLPRPPAHRQLAQHKENSKNSEKTAGSDWSRQSVLGSDAGMGTLGFGHRSRVVGRRSGSFTLLISAAVLLALAAPAQAAFPGKNGKIAFTGGSQLANYQLETIESDGTARDALFEGSSPAWSADGRRLAFTRGSNVYTSQSDTGTFLQLTNHNPCDLYTTCVSSGDATWSPDGQWLAIYNAYCAYHGGCYFTTVKLPLAGWGGFSEILGDAANPAWSPDGSWIAVDIYGRIAKVTPWGQGSTQLSSGLSDSRPNWSPDGARIAFARTDGGSDGIWVMNADGSDQTRITNNPTGDFDSDPAWSPDGSKIVFVRQGDLYTINPDGTGEANITKTANVTEFSPDWQPLLGPQRADYKNAAQFCKAERNYFGDEGFRNRYGGSANAHGKCVSGDGR